MRATGKYHQSLRRPRGGAVALFLAALVSWTGCDRAPQGPASSGKGAPYKPRYDTIAHRVLDLESKLGTPPNYRKLDGIIDDVRRRTLVRREYSPEDAAAIVQVIQDVLWEKNYLYKAGVELFTEAFKERYLTFAEKNYIRKASPIWENWFPTQVKLGELYLTPKQKVEVRQRLQEQYSFADCDMLALIYVAIGEAMDLPIRMVLLPDHAFIRWHFSETDFDSFESTDGRRVDEARYREYYGITRKMIRSRVFLASMTHDEILSHAYLCRSQGWLATGGRQLTMKDLDKALELNPHSVDAFYLRGHIWALREKWQEAIADFSNAIMLYRGKGEYHLSRGRAYARTGEYRRAVDDFDEALLASPGDVGVIRERGVAHMALGEFDEALADLNSALESDPESAPLLEARAHVYLEKDDYDRALADCEKTIELCADHDVHYRTRAQIHAARHEYPQAIEDMNRAIEKSRFSASGYVGRGMIYYQMGEHRLAVKDYRKALLLAPGDSGVLNNLAWVYITTKDPQLCDLERGRELAEKAVERERSAYSLDTLAAACSETGEFERAIELEREAISKCFTNEQRGRMVEVLNHYEQWRPYSEVDDDQAKPPAIVHQLESDDDTQKETHSENE